MNVEVTGLPDGTTITVINGGDAASVGTGTTTTVTTDASEGDEYSVIVPAQPDGYECVVEEGSGTMPAQDVTVQIVCTPVSNLQI